MRDSGGSRIDQVEVLDNCCHVTSALGTLCSKGHIITRMFNINGKISRDMSRADTI